MRKISIMAGSYTRRESESFTQYLKDVAEIKLLTVDEEVELTRKISLGDSKAIDELVKRNLRFVISVAKQYASSKVSLEDLVNEGNIGLIMAAGKFDSTTGNKFITFAIWWIQKLILEYISKFGSTVRLPSNKINGVSRLDKRVRELEQKFGRAVDIEEIISEFGSGDTDGDNYSQLELLRSFSIHSLDRPTNVSDDSSNSGTLVELLVYDDDLMSDHLVTGGDVKEKITLLLEKLKPRDKDIMIALFGLDGFPPRNLEEVANSVTPKLTREMIRQIRIKSLKKLKLVLDKAMITEDVL